MSVLPRDRRDNGCEPDRLPRVLVLMATYNAGEWLAPQIQTILSQQGVEVTMIIGDDVSSDGTASALVNEWSGNTHVQLVGWDTPSGSAGANFRRLYRLAKLDGFDFVALADQDDLWYPGKLIGAIASLKQSGAHGYSSAVEAFWPDGRKAVIAQKSHPRKMDFLFEGGGQGCTFVLDVSFFKRVQEFCIINEASSESFHYHDWLIYLLARRWNLSWYFDPLPSMSYRQHGGNEIGSRGGFGAILKRLSLIRSGWFRVQIGAALKLALQAGPVNSEINNFTRLFNAPQSIIRRFLLARESLLRGRRRLSDRCVVALAAVAGWI